MKRSAAHNNLPILVIVMFFILGGFILLNIPQKQSPAPLYDQDVLLVGEYQPASLKPVLLSIDPSDFSVRQLNFDLLGLPNTVGIHEVRTFMINHSYYMALATYVYGKMMIIQTDDVSFHNPRIVFTDTFKNGERVRSLDTVDIRGDGKKSFVIGTRPGGILKLYEYRNGTWTGTVIDTLGSAIHDIIVVGNNKQRDIIVTTSTTEDATPEGLGTKEPAIIRYRLVAGKWNKTVLWKPDPPVSDNGIYVHARYIFNGNVEADGTRNLVAGVMDNTKLIGLLTLRPFKDGYTPNIQDISGVPLSKDVITSGDLYNNGKTSILVPSLTGEDLVVFSWEGNKWTRSVLTSNLVDSTIKNEHVVALTVINSPSGPYKRILYVTSPDDTASQKQAAIYILSYDGNNKKWEKSMVNSMSLPNLLSWGMFPASAWELPPPVQK